MRVQECFEHQAERQPRAPAIITDEGILPYADLDRWANGLGHALLALALRPQEPVGVLVHRAADLPLAFLAVLKAGGVYVPMVADLPPQRLANMAAQAGMRLLIALDGLAPPVELLAALAGNAGDGAPSGVLRPEEQTPDGQRCRRAGTPGDLAAILFTSGSTGQPKGVLIQHDACLNMGLSHIDAHGITADDRFLLSSSPGFILGFRELCLPLMAGAAYAPASRRVLDEPARLLALMSRHRVSVALFTPSYLRLLGGAVPDGLRCILTAGERPNPDDARHYARRLDYWNMHGATEVCGTICMQRVTPDGDGTVPSGRPFTNMAVHLLDKAGNEVPPGEVGEIHVVGVGVSRGYLNQPGLTAAAFVETRFGRAYRSGDLGRWNADGLLEALGRADDMVKVSGQSVSLGEIERTLLRHPAATRAAAVQHGGRLVAFVESRQPDDWLAFLTQSLPGYMIPARVLTVPRLPISSAGKVDRQALLALAAENRPDGGTPPQGEVEHRIAAVWEEVLDTRPIMRDDNFFARGGTSLRAIAICQKLQAQGLAVAVQDLLAALTVAALADRIPASDTATDGALAADRAADHTIGRATAGQQDFWIAATLGLAPAGSHVARVAAVRGAVPPLDRWQTAWRRLIDRHPALRTAFFTDPDTMVCWRTMEASSWDPLPEGARLTVTHCPTEQDAGAFVNQQVQRPFDLTRAPLARAGVIRLAAGEDETLFWFVLHHAVADGVSASIVQDDMLALLLDRPLPPAPHGTALAERAERRHLASPLAERDRAYWQDTLDAVTVRGDDAFGGLARDRHRPAGTGGGMAPPLTERLDAETVSALTVIARNHGAGLHGLLLAVLGAEVRRRHGRSAMILGSGVSIRPAGGETAVGHFVNLVPVVLTDEGTADGGPLARRLRTAQDALTGAVTHAGYPAGQVWREFRQRHPDARPASRTGLFDIALTAVPSRVSAIAGAALSLEPRRLPDEAAHPAAGLDLSFSHEPRNDGGLTITLVWNPDACTRLTAQAWLRSFAAWGRWLAADPARITAALPPLLPEEEAVLEGVEWGPQRPRPPLPCHALFAQWADRHPGQPAIVTGDGVESYAALDARSNRIAAALQHHGVGRGAVVAVLADCSAALPAAVLGVWKAGAAYLPLAHGMPADRLAFMTGDAGATVVLALDGLPVPPALAQTVETVIRPETRPETMAQDAGRPATITAPADLAYIIYTSGTTGTPKGVAVTHAGLVNAALSTAEETGFRPDDRVALVSTPGFDASPWEIALALLNGLALVPVSQALRDDPWAMKAHYGALGVTIAFHAPSYLRVSQEAPFPGLRILLTGGEAPSRDDVAHHGEGGLAFWNAYGPTEATILATLGRLASGGDPTAPLPAGRPLPNTRVTIRRDDGTPVPPGVVGEVWLGGVGLARGYLNSPELTAGRFAETPSGRFYRTGDLGRWTAGGALELAGRSDHQVKLHGQRVEPGEVEQALQAHPAVRRAVVLVDTAANDTRILRAFVHLRPGGHPKSAVPDNDGWRAYAGERLPAHMVPATVTPVPALPLTAAGKIDRAALLQTVRDPGTRPSRTPPQGPLETRIAMLWADLLGGPVAREDDFFALGGNSLLAVTMAHRLGKALGRPVPARDLFAAPTLAGFARRMDDGQPAGETSAGEAAEPDLATEGEREFRVAEAAGLDTRGFIIPVIRRVAGNVPPPQRWAAAWAELVRRHPALRTGFTEDSHGRLRRRIVENVTASLAAATAPDHGAALALIRRALGEAIAMDTAPLWRAGLVTVGDGGETLFWLGLHHAVGDGRSIGVLLADLVALLLGDTLPSATAGPQDIAIGEQRYLASPAAGEDARHWQELLTALPDAAFDDWPLDTPRSAAAEPGSHRFHTRLDPATAHALKTLARGHATSLHAVILTLLALEVRRRTGRGDFLLGTTATTRDTADEALVVGYGVNMLPLPVRLDDATTIGAALRDTRRTLAAALQHARAPFARICQDLWRLRPGRRHPARYPLFDIAVTENPAAGTSPAGLRLLRTQADTGGIGYERTGHSPGQDMVLIHEDQPDGGLLLEWHVNAALYGPDTARRWLESLAGWARWLAADIARAGDLPPALFPDEVERLTGWEHGPVIARRPLRFHELFESVLDRPGQAGRPAIVTPEATVTYGAVERQANAIAHALLAQGAGRGTVVGVLAGRSPGLPPAVLGVWKAGAVYLPLAADLPAERLAFMAEDAGVAHLLALDGTAVPEALARTLPPPLRPESLVPETVRPRVNGDAGDVAYILYTSGSTGRPKGTLIGHAGYVNMVLSAGEIFGLGRDDRTLMFASPSFDVSLSDIGVPLACGAALCPVSHDTLSRPNGFLAFLAGMGVTVADITPTYLRLFDGADLPAGLRILVTGGEAPLPADVRRYAGALRYYNAYGPTENTISSTMALLVPGRDGPPSCGRPLPNTSVTIRDAAGRRVPPGVAGEIWLGGAGLAHGYANRPDLTAAAFVATAEGRLYRSGDLGRWRDDGGLEVIGRIDDQVKLNGIRIEPGEIERALEDHPAVAQAVAVIEGAAGGPQNLWAFARLAAGAVMPADDQWRAHLAGRLPTPMIPAAVIPVAAIPTTPSGKVDKGALKARLADRPRHTGRERPREGTEAAVARVWETVLGCGPVHRDDDFFTLGGHSLLAIAVAHRLERESGHPVPARELFAEPTLAGFARRVALFAGQADAGAGFGSAAGTPAVFDRATESQREFWVAEQAGLDTRGFTIPLILAVPGAVAADERWLGAWAALVARHDALRSRFTEDAGGVLRRTVLDDAGLDDAGLDGAGLDGAGEGFVIDTRPDRQTALAAIRERMLQPFAMDTAPLWRAGLMRAEASGETLFWLALHHSVGDGVSLGVLTDELSVLVRGGTLPPPDGSPGRTAAREHAYLDGSACRDDAAYWRATLAALPATAFADWPLDTPRPTARTAKTARGSHTHRLRLDAATANALRGLARSQGASLHALMLALLAQEVRRRTGRAEFVLGTAASTRETAEEARVVGCYVTMLPLPCRVDRDEGFAAALVAMQRRLGEGLRHSRYPFARISRDFRHDHPAAVDPGRYPLFDLAVTENPAGAGNAEPLFAPLDPPGDEGVSYALRHNAPAQDMVLVHESQPDGALVLQWYVNAALYDRETARAWIDSLAGWARFLADEGRRPEAPLPPLLPEEAARLAAWEQGPSLPHPAPCLHQRFARLATAHPDRAAVIGDAATLTYAQVNGRADAIARTLRGMGVTRGQPVGVLTDRSAALPETALAVWKAGGCYLPLTRDVPADRLAFIARDAGIRVLLALDGHPVPEALAGHTILRPETVADPADPAEGGGDDAGPDDPAYILYTSGSTGVPKGVVLRHRGMMNLGVGLAHLFAVTPGDRALLMSSPSFDLWISDLVMIWTAGGALVPVTRAEMDDIPGMHAKLIRLGVTMATMAPSYLRLFERADLPTLRFLMTVGEPPNGDDARHYAGRLAYWNGYGPTENTAAAAIGRIRPGDTRLSAGPPMPNTSVHILDADGRPVPPGAIGEVWLGGAGLGIGYLNRPDLTAAAFVETPAGRRYRTGDLGRWSPDGWLQVLGRSDGQVKLRGQRVELGEIEHRLEAMAGVRQAVALVDGAPDGTQTLWAFACLAADAAEPDQEEWHRHLSASLPAYMVPAAVVRVASIPTTLAGKVDRAALLPALADHLARNGGSTADAGSRTPPQGAVEARIAAVWAEQLQRPAIAREDNFFALGGDSVRAIATVNRVRREFACRINDLYENPVLADFAGVCKPRPDHLRTLIRSAGDHWRAYHDGLPAYEAARDAALAPALADYEARNSAYDGLNLTARQDYRRVLLTGATGYLGAYLLRALLADPERRVTALVRGADDAAARARLGSVLTGYFGADAAALLDDGRLVVRAGDLRRDGLGLGARDHDRLADDTQAVFHCAANVNHVGHYRDFHADNVAATGRLLDLAAGRPGTPADVHFISTLSVCGKAPEDGFRLFSEYDPAPGVPEENYYVRSKQEAERRVADARDRLPNACIHRVGNVVFAAGGGPLQRNIRENAFFRLLGAVTRLGVVPDDSHLWLCHVDAVAHAVVALAGSAGLSSETHHVEHSRRDTLAAFITTARGLEGRVHGGDFAAFLDRLEQAIDEPAMEAALADTLEAFGLYRGVSPQGRARRLEVASARTQGFLARLGLSWPALPAAGQAAMVTAAAALF